MVYYGLNIIIGYESGSTHLFSVYVERMNVQMNDTYFHIMF